jgi:hypothetical protein
MSTSLSVEMYTPFLCLRVPGSNALAKHPVAGLDVAQEIGPVAAAKVML